MNNHDSTQEHVGAYQKRLVVDVIVCAIVVALVGALFAHAENVPLLSTGLTIANIFSSVLGVSASFFGGTTLAQLMSSREGSIEYHMTSAAVFCAIASVVLLVCSSTIGLA